MTTRQRPSRPAAHRRWRAATVVACGTIAVAALSAQSSVTSPAARRPESMFAIYEDNRSAGTPNYITADFLLTAYAQTLANTIRRVEQDTAAELRGLVKGLREALPPGDGPAAAGARDYLMVLSGILEDGAVAGEEPSEAVQQELSAIRAAGGVARSGIGRQQIDYSQFRVRGEYADNPVRAQYFVATKYAGTVLFAARESKATGITAEDADALTAQAVLLTRTAWGTAGLRDRVTAIERKLAWLFGPVDDLTFADYAQIVGEADAAPAADTRKKVQAFAVERKREPRVFNAVVQASELEPGVTVAQVLTGWRFIPQRVTPDALALQQLVFDRVGGYLGKGSPQSLTVVNGRPVKGFPLANELMGLLGSEPAREQLQAGDEQNFEGYAAASAEARKLLESEAATHPAAYTALLRAYLSAPAPAPQDAASPQRRLNTALAFWTRMRHLSVAYTKQSYTSAGKGLSQDPERRTAWIEEEADLYAALARLARQVPQQVGKETGADMNTLATLLQRCAEVAARARGGRPLSRADADFLNNVDLELEKIAVELDRPVVVDIHTDPNSGQVMLEGVALPVTVTRKIKAVECRGAVATHVEFKHPLDKRMTGEEWVAMLHGGFEAAVAAERRLAGSRGNR